MQSPRAGDRVFRGLTLGAGSVVLLLMSAIAVFLIAKAIPALQANTSNFLTETRWLPDQVDDREKAAAAIQDSGISGHSPGWPA